MTVALIAEDEPLLASELGEELARLWPTLEVRAVVHDGYAALREFEQHRPEVLFLDVQMPGPTGIDIARATGARAHVVFITAFDHYAVQAFEEGAVDYLVKPIETARLARALARVRERLVRPPADLSRLLERLRGVPTAQPLRWITVLSGRDARLITVEDICYFRADGKYVAVVTPDGEDLITTPLHELVERLDPALFWRVHRSTVVNVDAVHSVRRTVTGHLELRLKRRSETLRVSSAHAHLFKHF